MRALAEKSEGYEVVLVASNKPEAPGLVWASERGLDTWAVDSKGMSKEAFDRALSAELEERRVGTIALAGFMRILSPWFVNECRGLDTHTRAIAAGDAVSGCSVHVVTEELDAGDVLGQAEVRIETDDTPETLEKRVLAAEHQLYPKVLRGFVKR